MANLMRLSDRTAVVTGAASGIGRAVSVALAGRKCHVALADIDEAGLMKTAEMVSAQSVRVSCHRLDVADADAVAAFPNIVKAEHPGVDVLVNNAGVAVGGTFDVVSAENFEWLIGINFWGVVRMTRAFLPLLKASDDARLVNLSSVFGLIAPPGQTAYVSSKFAVRGFSESLRHELKGTTVGVTVVHPGGVATSIANKARIPTNVPAEEVARQRAAMNKTLRLPPEIAGETIVRGIEQRKVRVLVGNDAKLIALIERLMPVSYWRLFERLMNR